MDLIHWRIRIQMALLQEVEKETMLIEDSKIRNERLESLSRSRRWMK
jgi:hypothetical protein